MANVEFVPYPNFIGSSQTIERLLGIIKGRQLAGKKYEQDVIPFIILANDDGDDNILAANTLWRSLKQSTDGLDWRLPAVFSKEQKEERRKRYMPYSIYVWHPDFDTKNETKTNKFFGCRFKSNPDYVGAIPFGYDVVSFKNLLGLDTDSKSFNRLLDTAKKKQEFYRKGRHGGPNSVPWDDLKPIMQQSNIDAARFVELMRDYAKFAVDMDSAGRNVLARHLAEIEHNRWAADRLMMGTRFALEPKSSSTSPWICPSANYHKVAFKILSSWRTKDLPDDFRDELGRLLQNPDELEAMLSDKNWHKLATAWAKSQTNKDLRTASQLIADVLKDK